MQDFSFTHKVGNGSCHIFDRDIRVEPMQIVEVNTIGFQSL